GLYGQLQAGNAGQLFYLEGQPAGPAAEGQAPKAPTLKHFDLSKRKSDVVHPNVNQYYLSANGKKALVMEKQDSWSIIDAAATKDAGKQDAKGKLKIDAIEVRVDPRAEWAQVFDEAWRINRDYFYDPGMHGADWKAIKKKYAQFLPHLATRGDLDR